VLVALVGPGGL